MNIGYFPGCSVHSMAKEYDWSAQLVCERLGVNLREIEDWNCCGATAAHSLDHDLAIGLSARNLEAVSRMGLDVMTTPCAGCFNRLKTAHFELTNNSFMHRKIGEQMGIPLNGLPQVSHLLQLFYEHVGLERIAEPLVKPLSSLKLAAYYGCLITRPRKITGFDDPEQPCSMDRILERLGAQTVKWSHKAECCGGSFSLSETSIVLDLGAQVLGAARQAGAEALVVACPMCQTNLETRQSSIQKEQGITYNLPIIYFTQLMALAYGHSVAKTGLKRLLISPLPLLQKKGLA